MKHDPVYKPIVALPLMGITCTPSTADGYIRNMRTDGMLITSYKLGRLWCITESDIVYIRERIMKGEYAPHCHHRKIAA